MGDGWIGRGGCYRVILRGRDDESHLLGGAGNVCGEAAAAAGGVLSDWVLKERECGDGGGMTRFVYGG